MENWDQYKDLEYYPGHFCHCSCKGRIKVKSHHRWYGIPKYLPGHNRRGKHPDRPNMRGENNPAKRPEVRKKIRESKKGRNNPMYGKRGKDCPLYGRHHTKEHIQKQKETIANNGGRKGELNGNWQRGISKLPYPFDFNEELKKLIRKRDNYTCQLCGRTQEEEGRKLDVHHIDYIKENLNPNNLTSLCRSCNAKVNTIRECWTKFFQKKLDLDCLTILMNNKE